MNAGPSAALLDRLALQQLCVDYANAIDERAWDRLDQVFVPDARIDYRAMGGIEGAYPSIKAWLPEALAHFPRYMHFVGNMDFAIDGDAARGRIACINPMVLPQAQGQGGEETMILGLWYVDRYRRTAAGWRIVERVEERCFEHNMPDAFKRALGLS
jgi:hypothetical protein